MEDRERVKSRNTLQAGNFSKRRAFYEEFFSQDAHIIPTVHKHNELTRAFSW